MNTASSNLESIWRRRLLGIFAIGLLGSAGYMFLQQHDESQFELMLKASLLRGGLLVAAVWLAYPQLASLRSMLPTRTVVIGTLLVGVLVVRPGLFVIVGPLMAIYGVSEFVRWVFQPLPGRRRAGPGNRVSEDRSRERSRDEGPVAKQAGERAGRS
jgi:hypothetical protein